MYINPNKKADLDWIFRLIDDKSFIQVSILMHKYIQKFRACYENKLKSTAISNLDWIFRLINDEDR
jgi:hypothetical protein